MNCQRCNEPITYGIYTYSLKHFGRPLCIPCQKIIDGESRKGEEYIAILERMLENK